MSKHEIKKVMMSDLDVIDSINSGFETYSYLIMNQMIPDETEFSVIDEIEREIYSELND